MRSLRPVKKLFPNPKAFFFDMDATVICEESLTVLAEFFGVSESVKMITEKAMNGELDFEQALTERLMLLKGVALVEVQSCVDKITYTPGIRTFVQLCKERRIPCFLVSGGFENFAKKAVSDLGFSGFICNRFEWEKESLTGRFLPPLIDGEGKAKFLVEKCLDLGISCRDVVAVGDGANDMAMMKEAGFSVGYLPKKSVRQIADYTNDGGNHLEMTNIFF